KRTSTSRNLQFDVVVCKTTKVGNVNSQIRKDTFSSLACLLRSLAPGRSRMRPAGRRNSGCLASLLDRPDKFQQVGVDSIRMRGGEAVRQAVVENFLGSFDELGGSFS